MRASAWSIGAAVIGLAVASGAIAQTPRAEQRWVADGAPVSCIRTSSVRSTEVVDDRTINFIVSNTRLFVNTLPRTCAGLGANRAFASDSRTTQLCAANTITVVQRGNRVPGSRCGLGQFQPMRRATPAPAEATRPAN